LRTIYRIANTHKQKYISGEIKLSDDTNLLITSAEVFNSEEPCMASTANLDVVVWWQEISKIEYCIECGYIKDDGSFNE